jgi:threonine/homoserine/homoserine lactone efflux protein
VTDSAAIVGAHDLGLFVATVLVLNATPGVDLLLTVGRTLQFGVRGGIATALGISAGCVLHTLAAAFGLAALLVASAAAFAVVKWAGAAYLLYLAWGMLRVAWAGAAVPAPMLDAAPGPGGWALFRQGLLTNALNPKVALFFLALLPQFIDVAAPDKTRAFLFLGALMVAQGTLFLLLLVAGVARLRRLVPRPGVRRGLQGAGGLLFLWLAARLALTPRP